MYRKQSLLVKLPHPYCDKCTDALKRWCDPIRPYGPGWSYLDDDYGFPVYQKDLTKDPDGAPIWTWKIKDLKTSAQKCRCCKFLVQTLKTSPWLGCKDKDFAQLKSHLVGSRHSSPEERQSEDDQYQWSYGGERERPSKYERYHRARLQVFYKDVEDKQVHKHNDKHEDDNWLTRQAKRWTNHPNQEYIAGDSVFILGFQRGSETDDRNYFRPFAGRLVDTEIKFPLIYTWYGACRKHHINSVKEPKEQARWLYMREKEDCVPKPRQLISHFRLIDIRNLCVTLAKPEVEYAALSYIWGNAKRLLLLKNNLEKLSSPAALSRENAAVPQTFKDAFIIAERLNIRYIWIDALCIVQDSEEHLVEHMSVMGAIYGSAILTIVSDSPSADTGIPGISIPRVPHQATFEYNGKTYISTKRTFGKALRASCWERRAWCLQEKVFSKRLLVFTETQAFYHCKCTTLFEDTVLEPSEDNYESVSIRERVNTAEKDRGPPRLTAYEAHRELFGNNFWSLVENYTRRDLSYESDSIRAFGGILKSVEDQIGSAVWDIPQEEFTRGLIWSFDAQDVVSLRRKEFPSWSWAGWQGNAGNKLSFNDYVMASRQGIWDICWHHHHWDKDTNTYVLVPVGSAYKEACGSSAITSSESKASTSLSEKQEFSPTKPHDTLADVELSEEGVKQDDTRESRKQSHDDGRSATSSSSSTASPTSQSTKPLPEPLSYFPPHTRAASWETKKAALRERDNSLNGHLWALPNHPGEPDHNPSQPLPPLHHDPTTMPPLSHIIRAYTSLARLHIDALPDSENLKQYALLYNRHAVRVPRTGDVVWHVNLDPKWRGKGKEHDFVYVGRGFWPPTDTYMEVRSEILHLMLVEGEGEVKTRVQMVGPIDLCNWKLAKPVWKCVNLA